MRLQAFIVDHKARPESTKEANRVKDLLEQQFGSTKTSGLKAKILTLEWPSGVNPSATPNFETKARQLRYRALGKACCEADIPSLLLGHHEADQKETLIMRLIKGYCGEGLRVEGAALQALARKEPMQWRDKSKDICKNLSEDTVGKVSNTVATLVEAGMPWVSDLTNHNPTLSTRNSIRHLVRKNLLPQAIHGDLESHPSALAITADRIQKKSIRRNHQASKLFQECEILSFDARAGHLQVRLPLPATPDFGTDTYSSNDQTAEAEHIGARLVRHLFNIITPQDRISLQSLEFAAKAMFFNFDYSQAPFRRKERSSQPHTFTAGGVLCERLNSIVRELRPSKTSLPTTLDPEYTWRLSRQPYSSTEREPECIIPPAVGPKPLTRKSRRMYTEPPWQLWDGRYWIQVLNPTSQPLKICPCNPDRLQRLRQTLQQDRKEEKKGLSLKRKLKVAAPGMLRYTIPAIMTTQDNTVLALPTLNFATTSAVEKLGLQWRVRFRRTVFPDHADPKVVTPVSEGGVMQNVIPRYEETRIAQEKIADEVEERKVERREGRKRVRVEKRERWLQRRREKVMGPLRERWAERGRERERRRAIGEREEDEGAAGTVCAEEEDVGGERLWSAEGKEGVDGKDGSKEKDEPLNGFS
ncbi:MAG: hypothetical protein Q9222_001730 [Ikaeria aurantiellina]